jgi:hypothetical protein
MEKTVKQGSTHTFPLPPKKNNNMQVSKSG